MRPLLVLRPEPGASATAARARELGLGVIVAPLFTVCAIAWKPPDASAFDALLITSANALRHAGPAIAKYRQLPVYAVGAATAAAAREAGFCRVVAGTANAEQLLAALDPDMRILHLCGEHRGVPTRPLKQLPVYSSQAAQTLPNAARRAIGTSTVAMLHSPRAAALFADLVEPAERAAVAIVAISSAAADAAGHGWLSIAAAPEPTDAAMLAIARSLCKNDRP